MRLTPRHILIAVAARVAVLALLATPALAVKPPKVTVGARRLASRGVQQ